MAHEMTFNTTTPTTKSWGNDNGELEDLDDLLIQFNKMFNLENSFEKKEEKNTKQNTCNKPFEFKFLIDNYVLSFQTLKLNKCRNKYCQDFSESHLDHFFHERYCIKGTNCPYKSEQLHQKIYQHADFCRPNGLCYGDLCTKIHSVMPDPFNVTMTTIEHGIFVPGYTYKRYTQNLNRLNLRYYEPKGHSYHYFGQSNTARPGYQYGKKSPKATQFASAYRYSAFTSASPSYRRNMYF